MLRRGSVLFRYSRRCLSSNVSPELGERAALPGLSGGQLEMIELKDRQLRERHIHFEASCAEQDRDSVRRRRMIYRAKQRGWLEVDLLLGSYAAIHVPSMTTAQLDEFEQILKAETIDTFNFITGKDALPRHLTGNSVMKDIQNYCLTSRMTSPESYAEAKTLNNLI